jgi:hypothetical protein
MQCTIILDAKRRRWRRLDTFYKTFEANPFDFDWRDAQAGDIVTLFPDLSSYSLQIKILDTFPAEHPPTLYCVSRNRLGGADIACLKKTGFKSLM